MFFNNNIQGQKNPAGKGGKRTHNGEDAERGR